MIKTEGNIIKISQLTDMALYAILMIWDLNNILDLFEKNSQNIKIKLNGEKKLFKTC